MGDGMQGPEAAVMGKQEQTKRFGPAILAVDQDGIVTMRVMADAYARDADVAAEVARLPPGRGRSGFYLIRFRTPIDLDDLRVSADVLGFVARIFRQPGFDGWVDDLHYEVKIEDPSGLPSEGSFRVFRVAERRPLEADNGFEPLSERTYDVASSFPGSPSALGAPSTLFKAGILVGRLRNDDAEDRPQRDEAKERIKMIAAKAVVRHPNAMQALSALVAAGLTEDELAHLAAEEKCDWREIHRLAKRSLETGRDEGRDRVGGTAERDVQTSLRLDLANMRAERDAAEQELYGLRGGFEAERQEYIRRHEALAVDLRKLEAEHDQLQSVLECYAPAERVGPGESLVDVLDRVLFPDGVALDRALRVRRSGCRCGKGYEHCTVCEYEERYYRTVPPEGSAPLSDSGPIIEDVVRLHCSGEVADRVVEDLRKFLKSGLRSQAPTPPVLRPMNCHCVKMGLCNYCVEAGFRTVNPEVDREPAP